MRIPQSEPVIIRNSRSCLSFFFLRIGTREPRSTTHLNVDAWMSPLGGFFFLFLGAAARSDWPALKSRFLFPLVRYGRKISSGLPWRMQSLLLIHAIQEGENY